MITTHDRLEKGIEMIFDEKFCLRISVMSLKYLDRID
jgi:hypothetical protein